ncbi:MAG TPA: CoA transferase, partial [Patescibacteria group bacterium]|nr:CoA transferase [Patescibacteria group bacterium]
MGMLDDIRILDFSHVYFGPYSTMILGDMGADVVKIEPPWGELARMYAPLYGGMSTVFLYLDRNKRGVTLNLKEPKAVEIALALAEKSDVIVENFKRGTMDKLGLGYEDVKKVKPDIIYASLSGFGLTGPYMPRTSFAPIASSMSGWYRLTGDVLDKEGPPVRPAEWHGDLDPGLWAAIAILGAIRHHDRTGEGQLVDVAQLDTMIAQTGVGITRFTMSVDHPQPTSDRPTMGLSTFGMFQTLDGWVYVAADPQMKPRLLRGMDVESLETTDELKEWASKRKTMDIVNALAPQGVPVAPIYSIEQMLKDPHVKARNAISEVEHPTAGMVRSPGYPVKLEKTPGKIRRPAPTLGQHNEEVLTEILGYTKEQVVDLRK